ncbi:MAG: GNAT family N-acetyltransferase [Bacteroidales bacterium]|nr:GNAT family N-acetyltransferase [Bacteroidales bacterium]
MPDINITIIKITSADLPELVKISRKTYFETFHLVNSAENMDLYLNSAFNEKQLAAELKEINSEFYFAFYKSDIAGYLKINFDSAQTDVNDPDALELERIYVLKDFQGFKVGKELLEFTINIAKDKKKKYLWLGVWEKNEKAIKFYTKFGFKIFGSHPFIMGNDKQTDLLMKLLL